MPNNKAKAADMILRQMEKVDAAFEELMKDNDEKRRPKLVNEYYVPAIVRLADALNKLEL